MARFSWLMSLRSGCVGAVVLATALGAAAPLLAKGPMKRQQAVEALGHADPKQRLAGMIRLADIGTAADADLMLARLLDTDPTLRLAAVAFVWRLWGRSGDATVDGMYKQGVEFMQAGKLPNAVQVFSDIIARRPAFAEAWNKRATIYYMQDQYDLSMKDCDEVLSRIPNHFGALSGYAQMLAQRGKPERALEYLQRAYQVNPNIVNAELMIEDLRRQVEVKRKKST